MWPLKRRTQSDKALAVMDSAVSFISEKWLFFESELPFKEETALKTQIGMFLPPIKEGLRNHYPVLKDSPDEVLLLFVAIGIDRAGTSARRDLEAAFGFEIPQS